MTDDPFNVFGQIFKTPAPEEPMDQEVDAENRILIPCRVCGKECSRSSVIRGNPWVHVDDAVRIPPTFGNMKISASDYDHVAEPDYIDGESWEVEV